ncbi:ribosome hibernation-promoting factor, HPF/YfiA family [Chloroflexota bacterium]
METVITGVNIQVTPDAKKYAETKFTKLIRRVPNLIEVKLDLTEEQTKSKQEHYLARLILVTNAGVLHGEERAPTLFQVIDKVTTNLTSQIEHFKGKLHEKGRGSSLARSEVEATEEPEPEENRGAVVKVKRFHIKPMTLEEALEEMNLLGHDFFIFYNEEIGEFRLVYRRKDGNLGLIEPMLG